MLPLTDAGRFLCPNGADNHYVEHLRVPALSVGTYAVRQGGVDDQGPHRQDEVYVVLAGSATLVSGGTRHRVEAGSVVYVPSGEAHAFQDVGQDLTVLVLFAPPYDGP